MPATRQPSKSFRRARDAAFWAAVRMADAIAADPEIARLDAEAARLLALPQTDATLDALDALTAARAARCRAMRSDAEATTARAHRRAAHAVGMLDERDVASVIGRAS